jgi:hypothetical protein
MDARIVFTRSYGAHDPAVGVAPGLHAQAAEYARERLDVLEERDVADRALALGEEASGERRE